MFNHKVFIGAMNTKIEIRKQVRNTLEKLLQRCNDNWLDSNTNKELLKMLIVDLSEENDISLKELHNEIYDDSDSEDDHHEYDENDENWGNCNFK